MSLSNQTLHSSNTIVSRLLEAIFRERPNQRRLAEDTRNLPDHLKRDIGLLE